MTTPQAGQQAAPGQVNGTAPAGPAAEDCDTCVTKGEIALAILGGAIGLGIILMAVDVGFGGKLSARLGLGNREGTTPDDNSSGA